LWEITGTRAILDCRDPNKKEDAVKRHLFIVLLCFLPFFVISCTGTAWVNVTNEHATIFIDPDTYTPTLEITVNGETKTVAYYYDDEWEISWVSLVPWEEVTVRASVSYPAMSNPGLFEQSFRVRDGDVEDIVVQSCTGYQP
jgi:hypothetical protein